MLKKSEIIEEPRYPKRTGVLKKEVLKNVEREPGSASQYSTQKEREKKVKKEQNKKIAHLTELDFYDEEQPDVECDYSGATNHEIVLGKPLKRSHHSPP